MIEFIKRFLMIFAFISSLLGYTYLWFWLHDLIGRKIGYKSYRLFGIFAIIFHISLILSIGLIDYNA